MRKLSIGATCPCMRRETTHYVSDLAGTLRTTRCDVCAEKMKLLGWLTRRAASPTEDSEP